MKRSAVILSVIGLLALAQNAFASIAFVNSSSTSNNASAAFVTSTINVTTGNLIILTCGHGTTFVDPTNATDTIGNSFTKFANASNSNEGVETGYWAISTGSNAADTGQCNFASSVGGRSITMGQFSGIATVPLDTTSSNATNTTLTSWSSAKFTTTRANELIIGFTLTGHQGVAATSSGYSLYATTTYGGNPNETAAEYSIVSSVQTNVSTTMTSIGSDWMFGVGTFEAAPAGKPYNRIVTQDW